MKNGRNKKTKAKVESTGWKAPNKRKYIVGTKAEAARTKHVVEAKQAARTMIVAEKPAAPSLFWPFEVLRWWMPTVRSLR